MPCGDLNELNPVSGDNWKKNPIFRPPIDIILFPLLFPIWVPELFTLCQSKVPSVLSKEIALWQLNNSDITESRMCPFLLPLNFSEKYQQKAESTSREKMGWHHYTDTDGIVCDEMFFYYESGLRAGVVGENII